MTSDRHFISFVFKTFKDFGLLKGSKKFKKFYKYLFSGLKFGKVEERLMFKINSLKFVKILKIL